MNLPRYRCHKEVRALKIRHVSHGREDGSGPGATLVFEDSRYSSISVDEDYDYKHDPQPGGYYVVYEDGYESFSPAGAFESGYTLAEDA